MGKWGAAVVKFFYQPEWTTSITSWSYTLIILLSAIITWLEFTYFQVWSALLFGFFFLTAFLQVFRRQVFLKEDGLVLRAVVPFNNKKLSYQEIVGVRKFKNGLEIKTKFRTYQVLMPLARRELCYQKLNSLL